MGAAQDLELQKAFFLESVEILEKLDHETENLEKDPANVDVVNAIFRGLHTIKGNSSFLDLKNITLISHAAETLLDKCRKGEIKVNDHVVQIVRRVLADLRTMIADQNVDLDVALPILVIGQFMEGNPAAISTLGIARSTSPSEPEAKPSTIKKVVTGAFVRVDETKISKILSLVSELEVLRYGLEKMPEKMDALGNVAADLRFELDLQVSKFSRLTRTLSGLVFGVRLVQVNQVFQRFPKVVNDLAAKLGKQIRLVIVKGDAELDKAIVEAIADPMTHLIRNSADHGIEAVDERLAAGKPAVGTIRLNSYVKGNFVFIEIADDGRGIDGNKVLKKAIEKGIVPADKAHTFTENQKLALIFAPGFSTAEKVTDISGRGVGMDVVKSNINKLKGTVIIDSRVGKGTVIQLRFPMSVVVLFSLFVKIHDTNCAFPMDEIDESMDFHSNELLERIPEDQEPGNYLALHSLSSLLWGKTDEIQKRKTFHLLRFKGSKGKRLAFLVDDFTSIEEAIVQSVDSYIAALPGLQGATIRKDGSVALVLNTENILERALKAKPFAYVRMKEREKVENTGLTGFLQGIGS